MNAKSIELVTDILDLLAGVSAAPELIGRERLESFREKLSVRVESLRSRQIFKTLTSMYGKEDPRIYKPVWYMGCSLSLCMTVLEIYGFSLKRIGIESFVWRIILSPVVVVLYYWVWLLLLTTVVFAAELVIDVMLIIPIWIARRATFSRALLVIGFLLFLISSTIKILT